MLQPLAKFKAGQVSAAIWENAVNTNGKTSTVLKAQVQRRFKDRDGQWKSTTSLGRNEIPLAMYCLQKCFQYIIEQQQESSDEIKEERVI